MSTNLTRTPARTRPREVVTVLVAVVAASLALGVPPAAAATFDPQFSAGLGNDGARAATNFGFEITQASDEEQIDEIDVGLDRAHTDPATGDPVDGFVFDTDVPGGNDAQIGTVTVELYTNTGDLVLNGTLHDDNDSSSCVGLPRQCVRVFIPLPAGLGEVDETIFIEEDPTAYRVTAALGEVWSSSEAQSLDARLKRLASNISATAGSHVVFQNPDTAGTYELDYSFTSASSPQAKSGTVPFEIREYAPGAPGAVAPEPGTAVTDDRDLTLRWSPSGDRNGDPVTYDVVVDGSVVSDSQTAATYTIPQGTLGRGQHVWHVVASDDTGRSTVGAPGDFTVVEVATALRFTSSSPGSGDTLYVAPQIGAYVYERAGDGEQFGAVVGPGKLGTTGRIVHTDGFFLTVAYRGNQRVAQGVFAETLPGQPQPFTDLDPVS